MVLPAIHGFRSPSIGTRALARSVRGLLGGAGAILAFHRVDDRYQTDPLTVSSAAFRQHCEFLAQHFDVVGVSEMLDRLEEGRPLNGKVAITFDDGYRDNFTTAAPILESFSLPCTFFVCTGFIGSNRRAWWDERLGINSEWMDWHQVQSLKEMGFEIGAHTVNHANLGLVSGAKASSEILEGKVRLEAKTDRTIDLFSYPYGGKDEMSPENRKLVEAAGFRCALSCYGGLVESSDSPFCLKRVPVNGWFRNPAHLAVELLRY